MNFALPGEPSNLFLIDIDIERVDADIAWPAYVKLLAQIGIAEPHNATDPFMPKATSRSGGWHVYIRLPAELPFPIAGGRVLAKTSDCRPLIEEEKAVPGGRGNKEVVAVHLPPSLSAIRLFVRTWAAVSPTMFPQLSRALDLTLSGNCQSLPIQWGCLSRHGAAPFSASQSSWHRTRRSIHQDWDSNLRRAYRAEDELHNAQITF